MQLIVWRVEVLYATIASNCAKFYIYFISASSDYFLLDFLKRFFVFTFLQKTKFIKKTFKIFLYKKVNNQTASPHQETGGPASGKARARAGRRFRGV